MARARNIKPSFFQNEELAELDPLARLFFIGLWTVANYKGCVEFRPKRLKVQLLPYDNCDTELIAKNLEKSGFVAIYSVAGQRYLKVVNFEKHQNPHKNERDGGSEIPDIGESDTQVIENEEFANNRDKNGTTHECDGMAPADSLFPLPDSPKQIPASQEDAAMPSDANGRKKSLSDTSDVDAVFDHWRKVMDHPKAANDDKRRKLIRARLADGYTAADLRNAITGYSRSPWHMGENDRKTKYDGLDLILRDCSKVDKGLEFYTSPPAQATASAPRDERSRAHYDRSADTATMMRQIEQYNIQPYDGEF